MKKSALFGIAALGMAAVGVPHAFATIEVSLNGHVIGLSSPNSFVSSSSYAGFSWSGLNVTESVTSITLPTNMGINAIQGDVTVNVTNGTSSESVMSGGQLNPLSSGGTATVPTVNFVSDPNLKAYSATGPVVSTIAANNMGTIELLTSDSVALSSSTTINSVNSVIIATTTSVPVPAPATLGLFAVGGLALLVGARRRKTNA